MSSGGIALPDLVAEFVLDLSNGLGALKQIGGRMRAFQQELDTGMVTAAKKAEAAFSGLGATAGQALTDLSVLGRQNLVALGALGTAVGLLGRQGVRAFGDFEEAAANVQNITSWTNEEMDALRQRILALPGALGKPIDLMRSLYQVISAGVPKENALDFLIEAAKTAKGNLGDLWTTVTAGTTILAAYGLETSKANDVFASMIRTVDLGKVTFDELSNSVGKGVAIAAQAGISYQELLATLTTLTLSGLDADMAMVAIRQILVNIISPSTEAAKVMGDLGLELSASTLRSRGLAATMADVARAARGNVEATTALFGNVRALNGAMALTSAQGMARQKYALDQISEASGRVETNFTRMSKTLRGEAAATAAELEKSYINLGQELATFLKPLEEQLANLLKVLNALPRGVRVVTVDLGGLAAAATAAGVGLSLAFRAGDGFKKFAATVTGIALRAWFAEAAEAAGALGAAVAGIATAPITIVLGTLAALVGAWEAFGKKALLEAKPPLDELAKSMANNSDEMTQAIDHLNQLRESLGVTSGFWEASAEATAENARFILERIESLESIHRRRLRQMAVDDFDYAAAQKRAVDQVLAQLQRQKAQLESFGTIIAATGDQLASMYGVVTKAAAEAQARKLAADIGLMAANGMDAAQMSDTLKKKVQEAMDAIKQSGGEAPEALKGLAQALSDEKGIGVGYYSQRFLDQLAEMPTAADEASKVMQSSIGGTMLKAAQDVNSQFHDMGVTIATLAGVKIPEATVKAGAALGDLAKQLDTLLEDRKMRIEVELYPTVEDLRQKINAIIKGEYAGSTGSGEGLR